jgi:hypothetical protein
MKVPQAYKGRKTHQNVSVVLPEECKRPQENI